MKLENIKPGDYIIESYYDSDLEPWYSVGRVEKVEVENRIGDKKPRYLIYLNIGAEYYRGYEIELIGVYPFKCLSFTHGENVAIANVDWVSRLKNDIDQVEYAIKKLKESNETK